MNRTAGCATSIADKMNYNYKDAQRTQSGLHQNSKQEDALTFIPSIASFHTMFYFKNELEIMTISGYRD